MITKKCRVCGKDYNVCKNAARNPNNKTFRWQEVACSVECGAEYFRQVEMSRNTQATTLEKVDNVHTADAHNDEDFDEHIAESLFDEVEPDEFGDE